MHKATSEKQHGVCRLLVEAGATLNKTNFQVRHKNTQHTDGMKSYSAYKAHTDKRHTLTVTHNTQITHFMFKRRTTQIVCVVGKVPETITHQEEKQHLHLRNKMNMYSQTESVFYPLVCLSGPAWVCLWMIVLYVHAQMWMYTCTCVCVSVCVSEIGRAHV